jgi:hypothetical protein
VRSLFDSVGFRTSPRDLNGVGFGGILGGLRGQERTDGHFSLTNLRARGAHHDLDELLEGLDRDWTAMIVNGPESLRS